MFFDELGPPWPKHPCTDSGSISAGVAEAKRKLPVDCSAWVDEGWRPIELRYDAEVDNFFRVCI